MVPKLDDLEGPFFEKPPHAFNGSAETLPSHRMTCNNQIFSDVLERSLGLLGLWGSYLYLIFPQPFKGPPISNSVGIPQLLSRQAGQAGFN